MRLLIYGEENEQRVVNFKDLLYHDLYVFASVFLAM